MKNKKEKAPDMALEMQETIRQLLKKHIVGIVQDREEGFDFYLPGGKTVHISVENV